MSREEILNKVNEVFHELFEDDGLVITENTTAADIDDWDSLSHITLISEIESAFGVRFPMKQVLTMKNIGDMLDIIAAAL